MSSMLSFFHDIEKTMIIKSGNAYKGMVCPAEAHNLPIHNWYRFKEGYSPNLLKSLMKYFRISEPLRILDPFSGSGTTLLSASLDSSINLEYGTGYEVNPFISFMANTKLNYYKLRPNVAKSFISLLLSINIENQINNNQIPELSTIRKAYSQLTLTRLINLKEIIKNQFEPDSYEHDFFMLVYASILENIGTMRKSGRALKICRDMQDYDVKHEFIIKATKMITDTENIHETRNSNKITLINDDVRKIQLNQKPHNLVLFSPPYLNNFDYTEVYKVELWMLDFINTSEQFRDLRYQTMRSHPSVKFNRTNIYSNYKSCIIRDFIDFLDNSDEKQPFYSTIQAYIDDMYQTFAKISQNTSTGAFVVCIVANSLFGSAKHGNLTPIATDLLIAEIAQDVGFTVSEISIARRVNRRGVSFPYGRESLIILRKSESNSQVQLANIYKNS